MSLGILYEELQSKCDFMEGDFEGLLACCGGSFLSFGVGEELRDGVLVSISPVLNS